jgi:threonyl-tRNA synthetase
MWGDNEKHRPIMLHRTVFGSIERFLGILIEHFEGRFPLWLAPVQAVLLPINDDLAPFAREVATAMAGAGLRVEVDDRTESLNRKIREAQLAKTPLILTCGAKEQAAGTVSVRTLDGTVRYGIPMARFLEQTTVHVADRRLKLDLFDE